MWGSEMEAIEGVRFNPTDEELILFLETKRLDPSFFVHTILETNIYDYEPPQLFGLPAIRHDEKWCYFFCAPHYNKENSQRLQKLTETGYCSDHVRRKTKTGSWKKTGEARFIKAERSKEKIGLKRTLVFYESVAGSKKIRTNWVMQEYIIRYDPLFKKDFVLCRIKRKQDNKRCNSTKSGDKRAKKSRTSTNNEDKRVKRSRNSTKNEDRQTKRSRVSTKNEGRRVKKSRLSFSDEGQSSHNVTFDDGILDHHPISNAGECVVENTPPESQCDPISNGNHVAENISPESQLSPSCDSFSNSGQHAAEAPECNLQVDPLLLAEPSAFSGSSGIDQTSFFTPQLPIYQESQPQPSCDSISNTVQSAAGTPECTSQVDLLLAELSALNGYSGLEQNSVSALQSPTYPEWQPLPSFDSISSSGQNAAETPENTSPVDPFPLAKPSALNDFSGLDETFCFNQQSSIHPEQVECPGKETEHSTPSLHSTHQTQQEDVCGGDSSPMDTEDFEEWVSNLFCYDYEEA